MTYPTFTNGTVLPASDLNAIGLWLVKSQTIGIGVSSVTVTGAFSANYDNYKIIYQMGDGSVVVELFMRFNNSAGATYSYGGGYSLYSSAGFFGEVANNQANGVRIGNANPDFSSCVVEVISPFLATPTHVVAQHADHMYYSTRGGRDSNAVSHTGFTIAPLSGTLTGGTIRVYGYRN